MPQDQDGSPPQVGCRAMTDELDHLEARYEQLNLLYQVSVFDARPGRHLAETAHEVDAGGLALRLGQPGIAPEPAFVFPATDGPLHGDSPRPAPLCLVGAESCGSLGGAGPRRTYWRQRGAE